MQLRQTLAEVSGLLDVAAGVPVHSMSGFEAAALLKLIVVIERQAAALRLAFGGRAVDGNVHISAGSRDGASWLADATGVSVGDARKSLNAAARLEQCADVRAALASGELSEAQASSVSSAAVIAPEVERALIDAAQTRSYSGLQKTCRDVVARSKSAAEEEDRWDSLKRRRSYRKWTEADGMQGRAFLLMPDEAAAFDARLEPFVLQAYRGAKAAGRHETRGALGVDGLLALIETSGGERRPNKTEVVVVVDHEALVRGWVDGDERCEIEGIGSVPVSVARSLAEDCYLSQIVMRDKQPIMAVGKAHYIPPRLRVAVKLRDRCCTVPGCDSAFRLEIDHIIPVVDRGPTVLDNLRLLCKAHHDLRTHKGWDIVTDQSGVRRWVQMRPPKQNPWSKAS